MYILSIYVNDVHSDDGNTHDNELGVQRDNNEAEVVGEDGGIGVDNVEKKTPTKRKSRGRKRIQDEREIERKRRSKKAKREHTVERQPNSKEWPDGGIDWSGDRELEVCEYIMT